MDYFLALLEGVITFASPCLLPMIPVYVSYFAGGQEGKGKVLKNALGFVLGFAIVFVAMGAFAGTAGHVLRKYERPINLVTGSAVLIFGLNFMGILRLPLAVRAAGFGRVPENPGFISSVLFGVIFSVSWSPCVGAMLGSALMLAAGSRDTLKGLIMLVLYSIGLGIPFLISALLLDRLKGAFDIIKRHYRAINIASGSLLVIAGISMMTGSFSRLLAFFIP